MAVSENRLSSGSVESLGLTAVSRAEFEELGTEELIKYLATQKVVLDADEQAIFRKQKIDGDGLLGMTVELLKADGIPTGVASKIMRKIPQ